MQQSFQMIAGGSRPGIPSHLRAAVDTSLPPSAANSPTRVQRSQTSFDDVSQSTTFPPYEGLPAQSYVVLPSGLSTSSLSTSITAGGPTASNSRSFLLSSNASNEPPPGGSKKSAMSGSKAGGAKKETRGPLPPAPSKTSDLPAAMARFLWEGPPAEKMDLAKVKKLRMLLRHETTA